MDLTVIVATYGEDHWKDTATQAVESAATQADVVAVHGTTLHEARNEAAENAGTEWLVFLDADDELEPGYVDAMERATGDLRPPKVRYVKGRMEREPIMPWVANHVHACTADCLPYGNWLVIGTAVRRDLFLKVGGFRDFPMYEDWDLWVRCWQTGASIEPVPQAIYRAHVRDDSRNRGPDREAKMAAHRAIARANGLPVPE